MLHRTAGPLIALAVLVGGCAAPVQLPVDLPGNYFTGPAKGGRVGVVVSALPKPDTAFPGADCLLCIAVASGAHSTLTTQVRTFSVDELKPLKGELAILLGQRGLNAVAIEDAVNIQELPDLKPADATNKARKDFSAFKSRHQVERLLVVDFTALGVWRAYAAYVPTDVPRATVKGSAYLVDLGSHTLEWVAPIAVSRGAEGSWDEPPRFPGLTNAYYQALESAMEIVKKPFAK